MAERIIVIAAWAVTITALISFVPRNKLREAHVAFLFKQFMTWLFGLLVVQYDLIEYPSRLFSNATKADFTFEYFVYPAVSVIFNLYYPIGKSVFRQLLYYANYCTAITVIEVVIEKFTNIINYIHWTWYWTWLTLFVTFWLSRLYYSWYFRLDKGSRNNRKEHGKAAG